MAYQRQWRKPRRRPLKRVVEVQASAKQDRPAFWARYHEPQPTDYARYVEARVVRGPKALTGPGFYARGATDTEAVDALVRMMQARGYTGRYRVVS